MSWRLGRRARLLAATGGILLLLGGIGVWGAVRGGAFDAWLTAHIAQRLDTWLRFSSARAVFWPQPGVVLNDVALDPTPGEPTLGAASASSVTCRLRALALLGGRLEIGAFLLDGLQLTVVRGSDERLHAGGLERLAAEGADGSSSGLLPTFPAVRLQGATIEYTGHAGQAADGARLEDVEAHLSPLGDGVSIAVDGQVAGGGSLRARGTVASVDELETTPFQATIEADEIRPATMLALLPPGNHLSADGRLRATLAVSRGATATIDGDISMEVADGTVGWSGWQGMAPLHITGRGAWTATGLTVSDAHVQVARVSPPADRAALSAQHVQASFAYGERTLRIEKAELQALGGTWRPSGSAVLTQLLHIDAAIEAEGLDPVQIAAALRAVGVTTTLPGSAAPLRLAGQASGEPGGVWKGHARVDTHGPLTWEGTQVEGPIQIETDVAVAAATVALSNGRARARRIAAQGVSLDDVDVTFGYTPSGLQVMPLRARAFGGAWSYTGNLPVAPSTVWSGQLTATGVDLAAVNGALPSNRGASVSGGISARAQLSGTGTRRASADVTARLTTPFLTWDDVGLGSPAEFSGVVRVDGARLTVPNARIRAESVRAAGMTAEDVVGTFSYAGDRLKIGSAAGRAFGGRWQARGAASLDGTSVWNGTVEAERVNLDALLAELRRRGIDGPSSTGGVGDLTATLNRQRDGDIGGAATAALQSGTFIWDDLRVDGPAQGRGTIGVRGDTFHLTQASAQAARVAYGPIVGTKAAAKFEYLEPRLNFSDLRFESCGGTWSHTGWFTLTDGGKFTGQLNVAGAVPHEVATMLTADKSDLTFARIDVDTIFDGRAVTDWLPQLRASGSVLMRDGTMPAASVLRPIWVAIVGRGRVADVLGGPMTHVQEVSGTFELRQMRAHTTDFSLTSDDYHATALGSIGLDGGLAMDARIQVTAQGVQKMFVLGSMPLPTRLLPALPPIPARVTGRVTNPVIYPNVSALPATTVRWIANVLLQTPRSLGEGVLHVLGQVWNGAKRVVRRR